MKQGWEIKKLSEIGKIFNGNSINEKVKKDKYTNLDDGLPYIATKDVGFDSQINYQNGVSIPFNEIYQFKIAPSNTTLICAEGGSAGRKIGFTNQDVCFGNKLFALVPNKNVDSKYVFYYYFTSSFQKHFSTEMAGIIGGVSMNKFKDIEIPLPPLSEQQRIVSILDEAFAAITSAKANAEQNLHNAKDLFESYLQGVFENGNWETKRLGDLSERVSVGHVGETSKFYCDSDIGVPFLRSQNVRSGYLDLKGLQYITPEFHESLKKSQLKKNDILFVRVGANRGDCCVVKEDFNKLNCANIVFARLKEGDVDYIDRYCQSLVGRKQLLGMSVGAAQGVINTKSVAELRIPFPPLNEQQAIVRQLDALRAETQKLEVVYQKKIDDLEELKKSVLQKAFAGELQTSKVEVMV